MKLERTAAAYRCNIVYYVYSISHTPGEAFQARLLDNQEGANTQRYGFGKVS